MIRRNDLSRVERAYVGRHGAVLKIARFQRKNGSGAPGLLNLMLGLRDVLSGNLALVGPKLRPSDQSALPARLRFPLTRGRPGLLSLFDLRAKTNIDLESEACVDVEYLRNSSPTKDAGIVARSALASLYGRASAKIPDRLDLGATQIDNLRLDQALNWIMSRLSRGGFSQLAFVNPHCANVARSNPAYRAVLEKAPLKLADGIGIHIAARLLGVGLRQNLNGTDLFPKMCERLAGSSHRVFLLGGKPGVADAVKDWVSEHFPGVRIAGTHDGYFEGGSEAQVVERIRESRADLLLVAMGVPRQEIWIADHGRATGARLAIGVGGLFDFYSGRIPRAPVWIREIGLEWAFRLYREPRRMWHRYIVGNVTFLSSIVRFRWASRERTLHHAGNPVFD